MKKALKNIFCVLCIAALVTAVGCGKGDAKDKGGKDKTKTEKKEGGDKK